MRAITVANYFISKVNGGIQTSEREKLNLDPMKLQKILYYAQGHYLATEKKPLFEDDLEAWKYSPVIKDVYYETRFYGVNHIKAKIPTSLEDEEITAEQKEYLDKIWNAYGGYTALALSNATHKEGSPWSIVTKDGRDIGYNKNIPLKLINEYFIKFNRTKD